MRQTSKRLRKAWFLVFFALAASSAPGAGRVWPTLDRYGFIFGRLATQADLKRGDAVFVTLIDGKPNGAPVSIQIPQYGFLIEGKGKRRPVVVVQAETNERGTFLGMRDAKGEEYVATRQEVALLGSTHP